jgi:hypothetical protein
MKRNLTGRLARILGPWVVCGLTACTALELATGARTRLDTLPVTALSAALAEGPSLAPGQSAHLILTARTRDGQVLVTEGAGRGKVLWDSYTLEAQGVAIGPDGVVALPSDPRASDGRIALVRARVVGHPEVTTELTIPTRHDVNFVADMSASPGANGHPGADGRQGTNGVDGTVAPSRPDPGPGSNGGNGGNGRDGGNGQAGRAGPALTVWMTLRALPRPLLMVRVADARILQDFLVDPAGGTLAVSADGGRRGRGGPGGKGGAGGSGGAGNPPGAAGARGLDGRRGLDGLEGAAGTITVYVDPKAEPYLNRLRFSNRTGNGTPGTAPGIFVQPMAALW